MQSTAMLLGSALLLTVCLAACGSESGESESAGTVSIDERRWIDTARITLGSPRELRLRTWAPASPRPAPLLLLAHGFGGLPEKFEAMAIDFARLGYFVAAPAFPLTNEATPGGHQSHLGDFRNQPADVSFVLDRLLEANAIPSDPVFGRIDPTGIFLFGHSLGGVTTLGLIRHSCCRDSRIHAAILADTPDFLESGFRDSIEPLPIRTLVLHGTADATVDYAAAPDLLTSLLPPAYLVGIAGAGHSEAFEDQTVPALPQRLAAEKAILSFLDFVRTNDTESFLRELDQLAMDGHPVQWKSE